MWEPANTLELYAHFPSGKCFIFLDDLAGLQLDGNEFNHRPLETTPTQAPVGLSQSILTKTCLEGQPKCTTSINFPRRVRLGVDEWVFAVFAKNKTKANLKHFMYATFAYMKGWFRRRPHVVAPTSLQASPVFGGPNSVKGIWHLPLV